MKKRGVTLLEIIIALFVFAVGILAVIRVITTNIAVIDTMKVKIQAQSLAKEGIDLIFNIRDTNLAKGLPWNCAFITPEAAAALQNHTVYAGQICGSFFTDGSAFRISLNPQGGVSIETTSSGSDFAETFSANQLMLFTGSSDYTGSILLHGQGTGSQFARYISFSPVYQSDSALDTTKLLKVTSHVLYQKGSIKGETTLESFIGAIKQ